MEHEKGKFHITETKDTVSYLIKADRELGWINSEYRDQILDLLTFEEIIKLWDYRLVTLSDEQERKYKEFLNSKFPRKRLEIETVNLCKGALHLLLSLQESDGSLLDVFIERLKTAKNMDEVKDAIEKTEKTRSDNKLFHIKMMLEQLDNINKHLPDLPKNSFMRLYLIQVNNFVVSNFDAEVKRLGDEGVIELGKEFKIT